RRDLAAQQIRELPPLVLVELEPRDVEDLVLEVRRIAEGQAGELPDHRAAEPLFAARPPAQEVGGAELVDVRRQERVIVRVEGRWPEDMKESHGTGTAPVRAHQGVNLRLTHDALTCPTRAHGRRMESLAACNPGRRRSPGV